MLLCGAALFYCVILGVGFASTAALLALSRAALLIELQRYSGTANWVRWFAARKKLVSGIRAAPYSSSGRFCGRNIRTRLQNASRNTALARSVMLHYIKRT